MTDDPNDEVELARQASDALIRVGTIHNLRDVGGVTTGAGDQVRSGMLFRSAQLGERNERTLGQLEELDLQVVFDLRSDDEVERLPDFVPAGVEHVQLDVLADSTERIAAQLEDLFVDPLGASELLLSGVVQDHYVGTYRNLVSLPSALASYSRLFGAIAAGQRVLFHCTAGKDRTGWAAAAVQLLLGVPLGTVMDHFLASNDHTLELFGGVMDAFIAAGGDSSALAPVFMVDQQYLEAALDEVARTFGSVESYFIEGLDLGREGVESLRARLLEP